jgi:SAM-dependent methyltransferase
LIKTAVKSIANRLGVEAEVRKGYQVLRGALDATRDFLAPRPTRREYDALKARVEFLYYELSDSRTALRHLIGANLSAMPQLVQDTYDSFDYQWKNLTEGTNLLTDPLFKAEVEKNIVQFSGLPASFFSGKKVLDAGCGNGRYSYGLALLGAEVVAVDQSQSGLESARRSLQAEPQAAHRVSFVRKDLLQPLEMDGEFDFIWSFGVLHHTGDTYRAFRNLIRALKPGGTIFLMLYGEPDWEKIEEFDEVNLYWSWRRRLKHLPTNQRVQLLEQAYKDQPHLVHGLFDATSPLINDLYTESEVRLWLKANGFVNIRRTVDSRNLFIVAELQQTA